MGEKRPGDGAHPPGVDGAEEVWTVGVAGEVRDVDAVYTLESCDRWDEVE
jgi:hypothetical protein